MLMRAPRCRLATVRTGGAGQLAPGPHAQYAPSSLRRTVRVPPYRVVLSPQVEAWAEAAPGPALHAIDMLGVGDSEPKPRMKRPFGGWDEGPRTPTEWAEQTLAYVRS